jgi:hypothetical protein
VARAAARVGVVQPDARDRQLSESVTRIDAELRAAGFEVVRMPEASSPSISPTADLVATIEITRGRDAAAIDLWVTDRLTGKTSIRRLEGDASSELGPAALAIRAVELLRASMLELAVGPARDQPRNVPESVRRFVAPPKPPRTHVRAAAVGCHGPGGVPPALGPLLGVGQSLSESFRVDASVIGPLFGSDLTAELGTVALRREMVLLEAVLVLGRGIVRPLFRVGAGAHHFTVNGEATSPHVGQRDEVWSAALLAGSGVRMALSSQWSLAIDASLTVLAPAIEVRAAGEQLARAGRPIALLGVGPEWSF